MPRQSAFRGTYKPNARPYLTIAADAYVSIQGQTTVKVCGECSRTIDINRYVVGINSDANVETAPGSATINLSIPDTDVNQFYVDGQFVLISMMEIEVFSKGYFLVGGVPQYYRSFWGVISNIQKSWSAGVTTVVISCRDILRWWELTNTIVNSAFLDLAQGAAGYNLYQNQFSGLNPYTVILTLARESMGDFSLTTGSFTSYKPEDGPEQGVIASFAKDVMAYWQLKFGNIWNNLVLFGTSGQAYTFEGDGGNASPLKLSSEIFKQEHEKLSLNPDTAQFKNQPFEIAAFKTEIPRAGEVDFFQNETQSKLSIAMTARDQAGGYEFYCDTTGDIIFKPPFYNLNVMPNKPVSWIQDFEIIDDSITESEQEVYTHVTASGNAFGGANDWGLNTDITTPRTGVIDWHLLKRYGWRKHDAQVQWAGNPRKLFYHLLDWMDRMNAKRESGHVTIPYRPEIRIGFPVWIPKHDAFFYIQGVSHQYSPGGQATTTLTLIAKRAKFIAPKNIGRIERSGTRSVPYLDEEGKKKGTVITPSYSISFPSNVGESSGVAVVKGQSAESGGPGILRDSKTGRLLGYPNVVMVYRTSIQGSVTQRIIEKSGSTASHKPLEKQKTSSPEDTKYHYNQIQGAIISQLKSANRSDLIDRIRMHRYESGMTNAGLHDYAHDIKGEFQEFSVIPTDSINWGAGTLESNPGTEGVSGSLPSGVVSGSDSDARLKKLKDAYAEQTKKIDAELVQAKANLNSAEKELKSIIGTKVANKSTAAQKESNTETPDETEYRTRVENAQSLVNTYADTVKTLSVEKIGIASQIKANVRKVGDLNIMVRPVSDDFGFEVIGHNRYGRGAFIDRGKLQIPNPGEISQGPSVANKLNIQFASHGGFLTDNPAEKNLGTESPNFSELYEKMSPDEYVTGASFSGSSNGSKLSDVNPTSQQTYTDSINNAETKTNKAVFVEADALKRAKTMEELSPTTSNGLDAVGFTNCNCGLARAEWLTLIPTTLIQDMLRPVTISKDDSLRFPDLSETTVFPDGTSQVGTTIPMDVQLAMQNAANGEYTPINPDNILTNSGGTDAATIEIARKQSDAINASLRSITEGKKQTIDPSLFNNNKVSQINPTELNFYANDSTNRILNLGMSRTDSDSSTVSSAQFNPADFNAENGGQSGFFMALSKHLSSIFADEYMNSNAKREKYSKNAGKENLEAPDTSSPTNQIDTKDVFGNRINTLFDRASNGDLDALEALKKEANFNFGLTIRGTKNFKDQHKNDSSGQSSRSLAESPKDKRGNIIPITPPPPLIGGIINRRNLGGGAPDSDPTTGN